MLTGYVKLGPDVIECLSNQLAAILLHSGSERLCTASPWVCCIVRDVFVFHAFPRFQVIIGVGRWLQTYRRIYVLKNSALHCVES